MRSLKDALLTRTLALPAAGASASTAPIDLTSASQTESPFEVEVQVEALPNLAAGKSVTVTLEDSANGSAFAAIAELAPLEITGGVGGGAAAASLRVRLPAAARRHLRATADVEANGGNNTAASLSLALVF
jgi:hypothetical protein